MAKLISQVSVKSSKSTAWHDDGGRWIRRCYAHWARKRADAARNAWRGGEDVAHCVGLRGSGRTVLGVTMWVGVDKALCACAVQVGSGVQVCDGCCVLRRGSMGLTDGW